MLGECTIIVFSSSSGRRAGTQFDKGKDVEAIISARNLVKNRTKKNEKHKEKLNLNLN